MLTLKEQAQTFVDSFKRDSNSLRKNFENSLRKNFEKWAEENKDVEFVIRKKFSTNTDELCCYAPEDFETRLFFGADEIIVEGTIPAGAFCENCPWEDECR